MQFSKKILLIILGIFILFFLLFFATKKFSKEYLVTFDTDGGSIINSIKVKEQEKVPQPEDPVKEGYIFDGWYYKNKLFDFDTKITSDITLKAKWLKNDEIFRLDLNELSLKLGETHTLNIENTTNQDVEWSSSDEEIVTVDEFGNLKALKIGTATITVMTKDKVFKDTCLVLVTDDLVSVESVIIKGASKVSVGNTIKLTAYIKPTNASNKAVSWKSSNEKVATVDKFGNVKGIKAGKVTITVTTVDGGKTAKKNIVVNPISNSTTSDTSPEDNQNPSKEEIKPNENKKINVTGVKISGSDTVNVGENLQLTAVISPSNATNQNVTWTSSDKDIATVDESGNVTGIKPGQVTITVTTEDKKYRDQKTIEVTDAYQIVFTKQYNNYKVLTGYKLAVYKNKQVLDDFTALIYRGNTKKFTSRFAAVGEVDENEKTATIKINEEVIDHVSVSYQ